MLRHSLMTGIVLMHFLSTFDYRREWITVSTACYIMDQLTRGYNVDDGVTLLLNKFNFIILPVLNVDGYNYSWQQDRMWRKTRSKTDNAQNCVGTDVRMTQQSHTLLLAILVSIIDVAHHGFHMWDAFQQPNRNWDFHWGEVKASSKPCSDSYQGPQAASEKEIQVLQEYVCRNSGSILGYINLHSYSQVWTSPYGYTDELPKDFAVQDALSGETTIFRL